MTGSWLFSVISRTLLLSNYANWNKISLSLWTTFYNWTNRERFSIV